MSIRTTVVGSYPKVTESGSDNLPRTIDRWQKQELSDQDLSQEVTKVTLRVIQEQSEAGLDLITDGQIPWEDMPHALARDVSGVNRGALRRLFDNNVYYRRLELEGSPSWKASQAAEEFKQASQATSTPLKVALPGPVTLVLATELTSNQTPEALLDLYTDLLRQEVEALVAAGVKEIQIDEPAFSAEEPLLDAGIAAIQKIFSGINARRWLAVYFSDVTQILPKLTGLKEVEVLSLDLVSGRTKNPELLSQVAGQLQSSGWSGEIALGLMDARNTKLETVKQLQGDLKAFTEAIPADRLWLSPNCGLEFLPHEAAQKKLKRLQEAANN